MIRYLPSDLFWFLVLAVTASLTGLKALSLTFREDFKSGLFNLLAAFGIGFAVLSGSVLLLGCLKLFYRPVFIGLIALLIVVSCKEAGALIRLVRGLLKKIRSLELTRFDKVLLWILGAAVLSNFIFCYTPPTQAREVHYNLGGPALMLREHGIIGAFDEHAKHFPFLMEMVYTLALSLRGPLLAKMIHYSFGVLSIALVFQLARAFVSPAAALSAACLFYLMPLVSSVSGAANVELGSFFYGLVSVYFLLLWTKDRPGKAWIILAGLMAGFSWESKITGLAMTPSGVAFILFWSYAVLKYPFGTGLKAAFIFGCFSILGCSPLLLKNLYYSGNPLFPFPLDVLGWKGHEYAVMEMGYHAAFKAQFSAWQVVNLHNKIVMGDILFGPGPLAFAFALPGLLIKKSRNTAAIFALSVLLFLSHNILFNTYFHRFMDTRFYLLMYTLLCVLSARGIENLTERFRPAWIQGTVAACLLFPGLLVSLVFGVTKIPVLIGRESEQQYLSRKLFHYDLVMHINGMLEADSKVVVLGTDPHWYYWKPCAVSPPVYMHHVRDPQTVVEGLRKTGATHVLIFDKLFSRREGDDILHHPDSADLDLHWDLGRLTANGDFREIYRNDKAVLYQVSYP